MIQVTGFVRKTSIDIPMCSPSTWSCFGQSIWTNYNDRKPWHSRLNRPSGRSLWFYRLTERLSPEANLCALNVRLLSEDKVWLFQKKTNNESQQKATCVLNTWLVREPARSCWTHAPDCFNLPAQLHSFAVSLFEHYLSRVSVYEAGRMDRNRQCLSYLSPFSRYSQWKDAWDWPWPLY